MFTVYEQHVRLKTVFMQNCAKESEIHYNC